MSLVLQNISKIYGQQRAVDKLSFSVEKGQILGFLGPNGAGKSTTMKMVCGYIAPDEGTITVCDHDVTTEPLKARKHIGYLPEHNPLYLEMYVLEYLRFVARLHKVPQATARIKEVIQLTGLEKEKHKTIGTLSKGYRQRVGLAQAIMHDPDILILDEPTSGLDMNQLVDIRQLIRNLGKDKIVILSTHIMQEVEALCDRVIIINNGKLVADDPIESLSQRMKGGHNVVLEFDTDKVDTSIFDNIEGVQDISKKETIVTINSDGSVDNRKEIFNAVVKGGYTLLSMQQEQVNVENVFQSLTKESQNV